MGAIIMPGYFKRSPNHNPEKQVSTVKNHVI